MKLDASSYVKKKSWIQKECGRHSFHLRDAAFHRNGKSRQSKKACLAVSKFRNSKTLTKILFGNRYEMKQLLLKDRNLERKTT